MSGVKKPVKKTVKKKVSVADTKPSARKPFSKPNEKSSIENRNMGVDQITGMRPRVWMHYSNTYQIKQYEPAKVEIGISSDVEDGESFEDAFKRITEPLTKKMVIEANKIILKEKKTKTKVN